MMDEPRRGPARVRGHLQGLQDQLGPEVIAHGPPHHPTGEAVDGHGQVEEPRPGRDVGDVGHPRAVWLGGSEVGLQQVRCWGSRGILASGPEALAPMHALQATGPHQPGYPFLAAGDPVAQPKLGVDRRCPIGPTAVRVDSGDHLCQDGIGESPDRCRP
jgi:hypothetical protein